MQRTIIVGDVHGCVDELRLLLRQCGYAKGDRVILAGDLVAKGPDSQGVVQFARENGVLAVLGNHDAFAIAHRDEADKDRTQGRRSYIRTLGAADWSYLEALPLFLRIGSTAPGEPEVAIVHAGLVPDVAIEAQRPEHLLSLRSIADSGEPTSRGPERVVFGHDAVRGRQQYPMATGIDSGCVYGRDLTALVLPEEKTVQVAALKRYAGR